RERSAVPVGVGISDAQLLVLNPSMKLVGIGELGEIYVRTPYLAQGYLGDEELTRDRFVRNPYSDDAADRLYKTGDLGRYLPDGNVSTCGRNDSQVKIRGYRVELGEVEVTLASHPAVREAAVLIMEDAPEQAR